jgi:hypothetical protein
VIQTVAAGARSATSSSDVAEYVIAGLLALLGVRSLVHWMRLAFPAESLGEHVLYALHVTARVGTWFGLALAFVGYALVSEPQRFRWFVVIILVLAAVQLLTAASLGLRVVGRGRPRGAGERG